MRTSQEILKEMEKVLEKSKELARELEAVEAAKKENPYWHIEDIKGGDLYIYVDDVLVRENEQYIKDILNETRVDKANAFKDEEYALKIKMQQDLIREMDRFSWENGAAEIDWTSYGQKKYYLKYEMEEEVLSIGDSWYYKIPGTVYFKDEMTAIGAVEIFGERIIELFK